MSDEKIQKVLARQGLASRREIERWIEAGRIQVNGQRAVLGDRISLTDKVQVDGRLIKFDPGTARQCRVLVYNKALGEVCTRSDPEGRPTVFDRLPKIKGGRWISVGRLDINTSGLLLFTDDGELANALMHPSKEIDREYAVRVHGEVNDEMIKTLKSGVELEDGKARFTDVQHFDGSGTNQWYHVVLMEGRNREVRRLWESQGVDVSRLKRVRYGCIFLPKSVSMGQWTELGQKELNDLTDLAALSRRKVPVKTPDDLQAEKRLRGRHAPRREGAARRR